MNSKKSNQNKSSTLRVQEINSKCMLRWSQQTKGNNINHLSDCYTVEIQKTYPKQHRKGQYNANSNKASLDSEEATLTFKISKLINFHTQITLNIDDATLSKSGLMSEEIIRMQQQELDELTSFQIYRNQYCNQIKSEIELFDIQLLEQETMKTLLDNKKSEFLQEELSKSEILSELALLEKQSKILREEYDPIQVEISQLQNQLQIIEKQNEFLKQQCLTKFLQVNIIQEQYNYQKRSVKAICVFVNKANSYDQNYDPYFTLKNQKHIEIISKQSLGKVTYSMSGNKKNAITKSRNSNYTPKHNSFKVDQIIQRQQSNDIDLSDELLRNTKIFLTQLCFKSIDHIYKTIPFNSFEYSAIYNNDKLSSHDLQKMHALLNNQKTENQDSIIIYCARKLGTFGMKYLEKVIMYFENLQSQFTQLLDLKGQCFLLNLTNETQTTLYEFSLLDYSDKIWNIKFNLDQQEIIQVKLLMQFNNNVKRQLHFLFIIPEKIVNQESFCRQFKSCFKGEKCPKENIGQKLESLIKHSDKICLVTELPEMVKITSNFSKKVNEIKNVLAFAQRLSTRIYDFSTNKYL